MLPIPRRTSNSDGRPLQLSSVQPMRLLRHRVRRSLLSICERHHSATLRLLHQITLRCLALRHTATGQQVNTLLRRQSLCLLDCHRLRRRLLCTHLHCLSMLHLVRCPVTVQARDQCHAQFSVPLALLRLSSTRSIRAKAGTHQG